MTGDKAEPNRDQAARHVGPNQLRALFDAIAARFGHETASEIWYEVFGEHDATAQT